MSICQLLLPSGQMMTYPGSASLNSILHALASHRNPRGYAYMGITTEGGMITGEINATEILAITTIRTIVAAGVG